MAESHLVEAATPHRAAAPCQSGKKVCFGLAGSFRQPSHFKADRNVNLLQRQQLPGVPLYCTHWLMRGVVKRLSDNVIGPVKNAPKLGVNV